MKTSDAKVGVRIKTVPYHDPRLSELTPREREVLDLIGRGLSTADIAEKLHRSQMTIKSHRLALGRKLGVSNRVELARIAIEAGLAPLESPSESGQQVTNRELREELSKREHAEQALRAIDAGTVSATGRDFFRLLVQHVADALHVNYALVGRYHDHEAELIETIATWSKGNHRANIRFKVPLTPFAPVIREGTYFCRDVSQETFVFPDPLEINSPASFLGTVLRDPDGNPLGVLAVVHDESIDELLEPELILRIFADRAGAELQRLDVEAALRQSEARLAEAQRIARIGHFDWDIVKDKIVISEEVRRILGVTPEDYRSKFQDAQSRVHPDDRELFNKSVRAALEHGQPYALDLRLVRSDGEIQYVHEEAEVTFDKSGNPIRMLGTVQDIRDRKLLEETLYNIARGFSTETGDVFFQSIVAHLAHTLDADAALVGTLIEGEADRVQTLAALANGSPVENFIYDLQGTPCNDVVNQTICCHPTGVQQAYPEDEMLRQLGADAYVGTPLVNSRGRNIGLLVVLFARPVVYVARTKSMLEIYAVRVAAELERMQSEAKIRQSEQLHRLIAENVPAMVAYVDTDERFRFINDMYADWYRLPREEIVGRTIRQVLGEEKYESFRPHLARAMSGEALEYIKQSGGASNERLRWFTVRCAPDRTPEGDLRGVYFLATDITEHVTSVESLRSMFDALGLQFKDQQRELTDATEELRREITRRVEVEQSLREAQARLEQRLSSGPAVMYTAEPRGGYAANYFSDNVRDMLGYEADELIAHADEWMDWVHPDDRPGLQEKIAMHRPGDFFVHEFRYRHKDGSYRWIRDEMNTITDEAGEPVELLGFILDITERKAIEAQVEQAKRKLDIRVRQRLVEMSVPNATARFESVHDVRAAQSVSEILKSTAAATGVEFFHLLVEHLSETLNIRHTFLNELAEYDGDRLRVVSAWSNRRHLKGDIVYDVAQTPCELVLRDGSFCQPSGVRERFANDAFLDNLDAECYLGVALRDSQGQPIGVLTLIGDEPLEDAEYAMAVLKPFAARASAEFERLRAEAEIVAGRARQKAIFASTHDPLVVINSKGVVMLASDSTEPVLGWKPDELVGQNVKVLIPDPHDTRHDEYLQNYLETGVTNIIGRTREFEAIRKDGTMFPIDLTVWKVDLPGDEEPLFTGIIRDISERKKNEDQLRNRARSETLLRRELDHRVRNNLSSLLALINLTKNTSLDIEEFAASIMDRIKAMADVHTLLSGQQGMAVSFTDLCANLISMVERQRFRLTTDEVFVESQQATAIAIVLHELITNSQKYGALSIPEGIVELACRVLERDETGAKVELEWRERGGPPIDAAPTPGLGTQIIEGLARSDLRGKADLTYPREGVHHRLALMFVSTESH